MKRTKRRKPLRLHKHHAIGLNSVALIDWHLRHLWCCGWTTTVEMTRRQHIRHHSGLRVKHRGHSTFVSFKSSVASDQALGHGPGMVPGTELHLAPGCDYAPQIVAGHLRFKGTGIV